MEQMQKKMTAPGLAHRKRSGETNPFEVNVSNAIEHYIINISTLQRSETPKY